MLGLSCLAAEGWIASGRGRFYLTAVGFGVLGVAWLLWYFGVDTPRQVPGPRELVQDNQILVDGDDGFSIQPKVGVQSIEPPVIPETGQQHQAPPPRVPPVPTISEIEPLTTGTIAVGAAVEMQSTAPYTALGGQRGVILRLVGDKYDVRLDSGLELGGVAAHGLRVCGAAAEAAPAMSQFYAPMTISAETTEASTGWAVEGITDQGGSYAVHHAGVGITVLAKCEEREWFVWARWDSEEAAGVPWLFWSWDNWASSNWRT